MYESNRLSDITSRDSQRFRYSFLNGSSSRDTFTSDIGKERLSLIDLIYSTLWKERIIIFLHYFSIALINAVVAVGVNAAYIVIQSDSSISASESKFVALEDGSMTDLNSSVLNNIHNNNLVNEPAQEFADSSLILLECFQKMEPRMFEVNTICGDSWKSLKKSFWFVKGFTSTHYDILSPCGFQIIFD
eukprot:gene11513-15423_t